MDIISLIIIIAIIKKVVKRDKEKKQNVRGRNAVSRQRNGSGDVWKQCRNAMNDVLQQRQTSYTQSEMSKTDILHRAKSNVNEETPDIFKQQAHAEVCTEYRSHVEVAPDLQQHKEHSMECDFEGESDILKRVSDLIVMGYDGNMQFDRDFVAEGVEMLNSFSL